MSPSLELTARRVRALLPDTEEQFHAPLVALAAALFTAERATRSTDDLLARVDRRRIEQRLAEQHELRIVSQRAKGEARALDGSLAAVDQLLDRRQALRMLTSQSLPEQLPLQSVGESTNPHGS